MALTDNKEKVEDVVDISLEGIQKTKFRINGRNDCIIELNLSDLGITVRLEKGLKKLQEEMSNISSIPDDDEQLSEKLLEADKHMRNYIDFIFDSPVSDILVKSGTMYDPINGEFRYEHIIDGLTKLYTDNINREYKKINMRIKKHTDKYTGKKSKR